MKKFILGLFTIISVLFITSCADSKKIKMPVEKVSNSKTIVVDTIVNVQPYGLLNQESKIEGVQYKIVEGNIFWSIVLVETIAVPIWLIGWRIFEPVGLEKDKIKIAK